MNMKTENYQKLKEQLRTIKEIEDAYIPILAKGEEPLIDGLDYREALFEQAGVLIAVLEDVLQDEEDHLN